MSSLLQSVKVKAKSSTDIFLILLKVISGLVLGLTVTLALEEGFHFGRFAFLFLLVTMTLLFYTVVRNWRYLGVMVLDLFFVLIAVLLKMYIHIAPGA